jgi:hypothetical protein
MGWRVRDQILVEARFSAPVQNSLGAQPASSTMGTSFVPGDKAALTTAPQQVPRLKKDIAVPLLPFWAFMA